MDTLNKEKQAVFINFKIMYGTILILNILISHVKI